MTQQESNPPSLAVDSIGGWPSILNRLLAGDRLSADETSSVLTDVLGGHAPVSCVSAFLCLLRVRGESVDEVSGLVQSTLDAAVPINGIDLDFHSRMVDTCGTGGDRSGTINVSTMAALVVAAAGVPVCKHGNRASSSQTGSADVLEALGVAIDLGPDGVRKCLAEANMGFCLAPRFHPGFRHVGPIRRELGVATVFNFLGPLANPARIKRQVIGVSNPAVADLMLGVLQAQGATRCMVIFGHDGLDELTTTTTSTVHELIHGEVRTYELDPTELGIATSDRAALRGGAPELNAERVKRVLAGEPGPQADIVKLNAAAGLLVGEVAHSWEEAIDIAQVVLSEGQAAGTLERLVDVSRRAVVET